MKDLVSFTELGSEAVSAASSDCLVTVSTIGQVSKVLHVKALSSVSIYPSCSNRSGVARQYHRVGHKP